ncbi:MAG TPA: oligosaccharide flippase family protein, partial [Candidatus Paceibacterota bacterium]|nr:oligosaccharide flippase family protein [Candidatus Paceibacterota bacterium]
MMEAIRKYKDKSHIFVKSKFEKEDGAGWLLLQQLIIAPMSLITTVLLARILSIEDYGFYKYILSV